MKLRNHLSTAVIVVNIVVFALALTGCTTVTTTVIPTPATLVESPPGVAIDQIYHDYIADPAATDLKYGRQRLMFTNITVEDVVGRLYGQPCGPGVHIKEYFISGSAKFYLTDINLLQSVESGYILNVIGDYRGFSEDFILIENCWVESVVGNLSTGFLFDDY
jgi:hypothetical protein